MTFPGTEVRLTCRWFPGSSFLPFLKMGPVFPFFQGLHLTAVTFQISWRVAWQLHQPMPSGLWDASHQVLNSLTESLFGLLFLKTRTLETFKPA